MYTHKYTHFSKPGVPQGSILGPLLYMLHTADIPQSPSTTLSTFADDTAILTTHPDPNTASAHLQDHLRDIEHDSKMEIKDQ